MSPNVKSELLKGTAVAVQMHNDVAWREKGRERRKIVSRIFHTLLIKAQKRRHEVSNSETRDGR